MPDQGSSALSGAASGAAAGAALGPWGAAVGGVAGGLYGLAAGGQTGHHQFWNVINKPGVTPDQWQAYQTQLEGGPDATGAQFANDQIRQIAMNAQLRQAPQIAGAQFSVDPTGRQGIIDTTNRLGAIAAGTQQGAGEMAVNAQVGRANAAQMAAARASRGANAALAFRNSMRNQADIGLAGAGQAGAMRLQDQAAANQQLGGLFANLYGQDAGVAANNAQLAQAAQMANQQAQMQARAQNDAMQIQALGQMLGWDQQTINAHLAAIQQQRSDAEKPNIMGNLAQGAGTFMQLKAMGAFGSNNPTPAPSAGGVPPPNPGGLSQMYPHGDQPDGPVTMPGA